MADLSTGSSRPTSARADALAVLTRIRKAGHIAYFAGGCVRDELLGLKPKDYDIATDAPPQRVRELFSRTQSVGQAFGVILVRHRRSMVEVATFRSEGPYLDGRRPESVQFTSAEADAQRRDFTINGIFLDPIQNRIIDYVGGQADLRDRRLRAIGNPEERFNEDHLRLLRAVRFAARFDLRIDPPTADAIRRHAPQLVRISPERIAEELRMMLCPPTRLRAWAMLWELALANPVFRFVPAAGTAEETVLDPRRSVFLAMAPEQTLSFGSALAAAAICRQWQALPNNPQQALGLFLKPTVQAASRALRKALRISNEELAEMRGVLLGLAPLLDGPLPGIAALKRFLAQPTSVGSRQLLEALRAVGQFVERIDWLERRFDELAQSEVAPPPLITGDDLAAAGMQPGPIFKQILDAVYDAQLDGRITTHNEAMALALEQAQRAV